MADVFISYARADRDLAAALAAELSASGYSVWWDYDIVGGTRFRREIHRELIAARAVVVLWTDASVQSDFVAEEADEAQHCAKLIPIRRADLDIRQIPLGFRSVQTLVRGDADGLQRALGRLVGGGGATARVVWSRESDTVATGILAISCARGHLRTAANFGAYSISTSISDESVAAHRCEYRNHPDEYDLETRLETVVTDGRAFGAVGTRLSQDIADADSGYRGGTQDFALLGKANATVGACLQANPELSGRCCPILVVDVVGSKLHWSSAGDCALLLYRRGELVRLNEDHSYGAYLDEMARQGKIPWAEAQSSPKRQAQRSGLTGGMIPIVDKSERPLHLAPGDWVLLATQGLFTLTGDEIAATMSQYGPGSPVRLVAALLDAVERRQVPAQDNTVIVALKIEA